MVYASKNETYFGEFKNDKRQGEGMYTYANKDVYSGKWASGKKDG
jgi:radial spoke head protein 1